MPKPTRKEILDGMQMPLDPASPVDEDAIPDADGIIVEVDPETGRRKKRKQKKKPADDDSDFTQAIEPTDVTSTN